MMFQDLSAQSDGKSNYIYHILIPVKSNYISHTHSCNTHLHECNVCFVNLMRNKNAYDVTIYNIKLLVLNC